MHPALVLRKAFGGAPDVICCIVETFKAGEVAQRDLTRKVLECGRSRDPLGLIESAELSPADYLELLPFTGIGECSE
jgi:hypothetical protein